MYFFSYIFYFGNILSQSRHSFVHIRIDEQPGVTALSFQRSAFLRRYLLISQPPSTMAAPTIRIQLQTGAFLISKQRTLIHIWLI